MHAYADCVSRYVGQRGSLTFVQGSSGSKIPYKGGCVARVNSKIYVPKCRECLFLDTG